mmetsp:Transcript_11740/g.27979  ORF Transcript_11740/g.27979 Transcript_11740/m.27979 type:complete len:129 (+) Transcript_11740:134-520(+)
MCTRGVWQLQELTLRYCRASGSSAGVREFLREGLVEFARANPQLKVRTVVKPNRHPIAVGDYLNGNTKVVDLKNRGVDDVGLVAQRLRDDAGRKVQRHHVPVVSEVPSVQGVWDPSTSFQGEFDVEVP